MDSFSITNGVLWHYEGDSAEVVIPDSVTEIRQNAFKGCTSLTSVTIPKSVTKIGWYAFADCTSLSSVTIPDSVTEIESDAFQGCTSLTSVSIPNGVTYIGTGAFEDCTSLTNVTIPDSVTGIGWSAFANCTSLTSVSIPNSVTQIDGSAFSGCSALKEIVVDLNNSSFRFDDGILYTKDGKTVVACLSNMTIITIPDGVTSIGDRAFDNCASLTSVTIPDSVTRIGWHSFYGCKSLANVTIPDGVTSIGSGAFAYCTSLTSVTIPNSVTELDGFNGCTSLTSVTISDSVTTIRRDAFLNCTSLTSVTIPDSVTEIDNGAFKGCTSLTSVTIPNSVTKIGEEAFQNCTSLDSVTIPDSVTEIGNQAFAGCNIKKLYLGSGIKSLGYIFIDMFNKSFTPEYIVVSTLPKGITTISDKARFVFKGSVADITVKELKVKAITEILRKNPEAPIPDENEKALITEYLKKNIVSFIDVLVDSNVFEYAKEAGALTLKNISKLLSSSPTAEMAEVLKAYSEKTFSDDQRAKEKKSQAAAKDKAEANAAAGIIPVSVLKKLWKVKDIDSETVEIYGYKGTEETVEIPSMIGKKDVVRVRDNPNGSFGEMKNLIIPYGVKQIDYGTFSWCKSLTSVTIPDSVTEIGENAFRGCTSLTSVTIPKSVTRIGWGAFAGCTSLSSVIIMDGVPEIRLECFSECTSLTSITIPDSVTKITYGLYFKGPKLTIHASEGSYAAEYAIAKNIPLKAIE